MDVVTLPPSGQPAEQQGWVGPLWGSGPSIHSLPVAASEDVALLIPGSPYRPSKLPVATVHTGPTARDLLPTVVLKP